MTTHRIIQRAASAHRQGGAALVVGLLLLLVLTLLGVSSLSGSTQQMRIASNAQNKNQAFQFAESVIDVTIGNMDFTNIQTRQGFDDAAHPQYPGSTAQVDFLTRSSAAGCPGNSFQFSCVHFEIAASGVHQPSGARARHVQGLHRIAPNP